MKKLLIGLLCVVAVLVAQTLSIPTREGLIEHNNAFTTTLSAGIDASTLTIPVTSATAITISVPGAVVIRINDSENIKICSKSGNTLTACAAGGRGFDGTTAATHANGATVRGTVISPAHLNAVMNEVIEIATALGTNLANVAKVALSAVLDGELLFYDSGTGRFVNRKITEPDLPIEAMTTARNNFTHGDGTASSIERCFNLSASGEVCLTFSDGLLVIDGQIQVNSVVVNGTGFPGPTGFLETRFIPFFDVFDADAPNLAVMDGLVAKQILKVSCRTTGGGTETVTLNLTRNGTNILSASLVADNGGQSSCDATFGTCDVDTIQSAQEIFEPGDILGYDYVSQANSPASLSCTLVWKEVAIP